MIARNDETVPEETLDSRETDRSNGLNGSNGTSSANRNSSGLIDTPVLIVGAGPSGLLQAYLLSRLGIQCTIIERYAKRLAAPKAHALSPRSLEICRQFGLDTNKIRKLGTPRSEAYWVNFITNLSGEQVGRLPYERMDAEVLEDTPEMIHNVPQPAFEDYIHDRLPNDVRIIRNASFVSCSEDEDNVFTSVEDRNTGCPFLVRSKHVIACDGARSRVRAHLRIESDGEDSYETMMTIHFNADLKPVLGERLGMLHWIMDPSVSGFIIGYDLSNNQVLICNFDSQKHPVESWDENLCRQTLTSAIGQDIPFNVLSFRPWVLSRKVAQNYRSSRVFLAGDAAHSFPPTGGLGLNSGLADVHNLAYKIAAIHQGWGKDGLLDTYTAERRHIAEVNSQQSVKNGKQIFSLLKAMGTTGSNVDQARQNLIRSLRDPERRAFIDAEVLAQQEHFDNLELHIGYVYGSDKFPPHASHFSPKFVSGARMPHVWIKPSGQFVRSMPEAVDLSYVSEMSEEDKAMRKYSSLDLCAYDTFTFITGSDSRIITDVLDLLGSYQVPIKTVCLGKDFSVNDDPKGHFWVQATGLETGGGIFVRPDQHILAMVDRRTSPYELARSIADHLQLAVEL